MTFRVDRRIIPDEDPREVEAALATSIQASAARWPGVSCAIRRVLLAAPFVPVAGQEILVRALTRHASRLMGQEVGAHGVPLYTDARLYAAAGIPTVLYGAGPQTLLEANGHRADERLRLEDLYRATEVVALAILDLLGLPDPPEEPGEKGRA